MRFFLSVSLCLLLCLMLCACGSLSRPGTPFPLEQIAPKEDVFAYMDQNRLSNNLRVGEITLSPDMPRTTLDAAHVVNEEVFRADLEQSLKKSGWLNPNGQYVLNAHLVKHDQPFGFGPIQSVHTIIAYKVIDTQTQQAAYEETIDMSCQVDLTASTMTGIFGALFDKDNITQNTQNQSEAQRKELENGRACSTGENVVQLLQSLNANF